MTPSLILPSTPKVYMPCPHVWTPPERKLIGPVGPGGFRGAGFGDGKDASIDDAGADPNFDDVVLLLGFEGADEATTTTDESDSAHTMSFGAQAEIDTAQFKFGSSSLRLFPSGSVNPSAAFVSAPDDVNWSLLFADFTIELFVRFNSLTDGSQVFISHYLNTGGQRAWYLALISGNLHLHIDDNGNNTGSSFDLTAAWSPSVDTWYHVSATRDISDDFRIFLDGTQLATTNSSLGLHNGTGLMFVGKFRSTGFDDNPVDGHIDEVRITNGTARYTGNFTPPTAAFPRF